MATIEFTVSIPDPNIWDTDNAPWGEADAIYAEAKPVLIVGSSFFQVDNGNLMNSVAIQTRLVRTGLTLFDRDRQGNPKNDQSMVKEIHGMWPMLKGTPGTVIQIYAGAQENTPDDPIMWVGPQNFVIGEDSFVDFEISGRYLASRFESVGQEIWELGGYDLDIEPVGEH